MLAVFVSNKISHYILSNLKKKKIQLYNMPDMFNGVFSAQVWEFYMFRKRSAFQKHGFLVLLHTIILKFVNTGIPIFWSLMYILFYFKDSNEYSHAIYTSLAITFIYGVHIIRSMDTSSNLIPWKFWNIIKTQKCFIICIIFITLSFFWYLTFCRHLTFGITHTYLWERILFCINIIHWTQHIQHYQHQNIDRT